MPVYTDHTTAQLERVIRDADPAELIGSWMMSHASIGALHELSRRGMTERNAQQLAAELNIGIGMMMLEFQRRGVTPPSMDHQHTTVPADQAQEQPTPPETLPRAAYATSQDIDVLASFIGASATLGMLERLIKHGATPTNIATLTGNMRRAVENARGELARRGVPAPTINLATVGGSF